MIASPPAFLQLAGHPLRWQVLLALSRSDLRVRELEALLDAPQSLLSYHLERLRSGGLVSRRRSSADGRESYFTLDLGRCGELLAEAGSALHPGLGTARVARARRRTRRRRVLFLCTGNSARSQIAEALLTELSGGAVAAYSAGSRPKPLHANAVRVLAERGIDISSRRSTHLRAYTRRRFDVVVSLCDRVREVCPEFPGPPRLVHWSVADPAAEPGNDDATYPVFVETARELERRIRFLLPTI